MTRDGSKDLTLNVETGESASTTTKKDSTASTKTVSKKRKFSSPLSDKGDLIKQPSKSSKNTSGISNSLVSKQELSSSQLFESKKNQPSTSEEANLTEISSRQSAVSKSIVKLAGKQSRVIVDANIEDSSMEEQLVSSRLRRQSNSSNKSAEVPSKKQKTNNQATTSTDTSIDSKKPRQQRSSFWSKSQKKSDSSRNQSNKKETGGCISKPLNTSTTNPQSKSQSRAACNQETATNTIPAVAKPLLIVEPQATDPTTSQTPNEKLKNMSGHQKQQQSKSAKAASSSKESATLLSESGADSSDNDASVAEFSRLSDILQSRGLPSHIVNAFGSKVQQFLHRTMSSGIGGRSQNLINSLQQPDDSLKLTALAEICQLLVMGNEDTLVGFPIKQAVPLLLACMSGDSENFDLMNHACRALTYMMESLPRSSGVIASDGIGVFLEKLQVIQCMDVAEQALTALEILSRRHSKQILAATQSGSVAACLTYIDFFSITAQRNALQITARCCQNMVSEEFVNIQSSLPILSQRLCHSDKKSVESVCNIFARLVENFQCDSHILREIANHNVLVNLQRLLIAQPSVVSPSMIVIILHTIYLMCANCTDLASELLENDISGIFVTLLVGVTGVSEPGKEEGVKPINEMEILSSRSTQELYEIVSIISEIMPSLPKTGIFSIDQVLPLTSASYHSHDVSWQWRDERDVWRPYTPNDSRIIESSYAHSENECILNTGTRSYVLDFNSMMQINEETGTARPIQRQHKTQQENQQSTDENDSRLEYLQKKPQVYAQFVSSLFAILYAVYSSSAGPSIKHQCLRALLRMIYYSPRADQSLSEMNRPREVLFDLLKNLPISSHLASMLASQDIKILVSALQMCEILMEKLPNIFGVYFNREGVIHQIDKLIETSAIELANSSAKETKHSTDKSEDKQDPLESPTSTSRKTRSSTAAEQNQANPNANTSQDNDADPSTTAVYSKRKARPSHSSKHSSNTPVRQTKLSEKTDTATADSLTDSSATVVSSTAKYFRNIITKMHGQSTTGSTATTSSNENVGTSQANDFFMFGRDDSLWSNLKSSSQPLVPKVAQQQRLTKIDYKAISVNKEKVRRWIYEQAVKFRDSFLAVVSQISGEKNSMNVLERLQGVVGRLDIKSLAELEESVESNSGKRKLLERLDKVNQNYMNALVEISKITNETDISSFEMIYSGLIERLVKFLAINDTVQSNLETRLNQSTVNYSSFTSLKSPPNPSYVIDLNDLIQNEFHCLRPKQFLASFAHLPFTFYCHSFNKSSQSVDISPLSSLLAKLHNCVNQLEQFAVRVNDLPLAAGGGECGSKNAIKFFNTHQLKCLLRRHASCSSTSGSSQLSHWKGGPVKVDPLAAISTVEKYLLCRGIHRIIPTSRTAASTSSATTTSSNTATVVGNKSPSKIGSRFLKSKLSKSKLSSNSVTSKPGSNSRLFILKAAAEMATDKLKLSQKSRNLKTIKSVDTLVQQQQIKENTKGSSSLLKKLKKSKSRSKKTKKAAATAVNQERYDEDEEEEDDEIVVSLQDEREGEEDDDESEEDDLDYDEEIDEELDEDDLEESDSFDHSNIPDEIIESEDDEDEEEIGDEDLEEDDADDLESPLSAILGSLRNQASSAAAGGSSGGSTLKNFYLSTLMANSFGGSTPKIELLINDQVLPSNMSVYQAIRLYTIDATENTTPTTSDTNTDNTSSNNMWSKVHTIHYRLVVQPASTLKQVTPSKTTVEATSDSKRVTRASQSSIQSPSTASQKLSKKEKRDLDKSMTSEPSLATYSTNKTDLFTTSLTSNCQTSSVTQDPSVNLITLLRFLDILNRNWYLMYNKIHSQTSLWPCETASQAPVFLLSAEQFVNAKLTAKANRQLQDPLAIMTGHLPKWLPELVASCPFLFPFKTRQMYFYVKSLDRDRAMQKLIESNADVLSPASENLDRSERHSDRFVPKLEKKKRTVNRHGDLIKQTDAILAEFCEATHKPALLEIQYEGEVGTGLGPTLEFYALVSKEIQRYELEMWRGDKPKTQSSSSPKDKTRSNTANEQFFFSATGLFPAPIQSNCKQSSKQYAHLTKLKFRFRLLGRFMAKALMDSRVLDIQLSYTFYKWLLAPNSLTDEDVRYVDAGLYQSFESLSGYIRHRRKLLTKAYELATEGGVKSSETSEEMRGIEAELKSLEETVECIDLDFTLPGYGFELKKGGKELNVNLENLEEYLKLIVDWTLRSGVQHQLEAFKEGFESILSVKSLQQFYPEELERLFCGSGHHEWNIKLLNECTRCDHGYTHDSKAVKHLFEIMCAFDEQEQRQFLQFITGSPRLPVGGLQSLVPALTIVRKTTETIEGNKENPSGTGVDSYLPSVMTCVNYLKLPDYSSIDVMREKLVKAMQEGQLSFHLS